jgi:hypothetical protein
VARRAKKSKEARGREPVDDAQSERARKKIGRAKLFACGDGGEGGRAVVVVVVVVLRGRTTLMSAKLHPGFSLH